MVNTHIHIYKLLFLTTSLSIHYIDKADHFLFVNDDHIIVDSSKQKNTFFHSIWWNTNKNFKAMSILVKVVFNEGIFFSRELLLRISFAIYLRNLDSANVIHQNVRIDCNNLSLKREQELIKPLKIKNKNRKMLWFFCLPHVFTYII